MKKLLLLTFFAFLVNGVAFSQTYCYEHLYNVDNNGMKISIGSGEGARYYFTLSNNKNWCYKTNKDGVYSGGYGAGTYEYIGRKNNMLVYEERNTNMFSWGNDILYFATDYSRLNWSCLLDRGDLYNKNIIPPIRVLQYIENPSQINKRDTPTQLY